jgi:hypothetical protein
MTVLFSTLGEPDWPNSLDVIQGRLLLFVRVAYLTRRHRYLIGHQPQNLQMWGECAPAAVPLADRVHSVFGSTLQGLADPQVVLASRVKFCYQGSEALNHCSLTPSHLLGRSSVRVEAS